MDHKAQFTGLESNPTSRFGIQACNGECSRCSGRINKDGTTLAVTPLYSPTPMDELAINAVWQARYGA